MINKKKKINKSITLFVPEAERVQELVNDRALIDATARASASWNHQRKILWT